MHKQVMLFLVGVLVYGPAAARADVPPSPVRRTAPRLVEAPVVLTPGTKNDPQMYVRLPAEVWRRAHAHARRDQRSTLVAGVALALAFSLAGLWLFRGGQRRLFGGAALTLAVLIVLGVSGCPPRPPDSRIESYNERLARPAQDVDGTIKGEALLQVVDDLSSIQIVVPPEELATFVHAQKED